MSVLVVEDNKAVSLIISRIIEELNYPWVLAADGPAALRLYQQRDIHLIIMDVELPVLNGFRVAREIRGTNPNIPILFISATDTPEYHQQCIDTGGAMLMPKPLRLSELRRWLESTLNTLGPRICSDSEQNAPA